MAFRMDLLVERENSHWPVNISSSQSREFLPRLFNSINSIDYRDIETTR